MEIKQLHIQLKARNYDKTCYFWGEVMSLPRLHNWERVDGRGALYAAGPGIVEILGRVQGGEAVPYDESYDYHGPSHKVVVVFDVESAQKAYEELAFREPNIPGGLRRAVDGAMSF